MSPAYSDLSRLSSTSRDFIGGGRIKTFVFRFRHLLSFDILMIMVKENIILYEISTATNYKIVGSIPIPSDGHEATCVD